MPYDSNVGDVSRLTVDLVVKNCKVVTTEGIYDAGIAIDDGKIIGVSRDSNLPRADKTIDAGGRPVLPGAIDPHVHLGRYNDFAEDVRDSTGTMAVGGLTTIMHSVSDKRPHKEVIPEINKKIEENAYIDMTSYSYIMSMEHVAQMEDVFKLGVISFKHFLNRPEFTAIFGTFHPDAGELYESFEKIKRLGGVAMVHCENYELSRRIANRVKASKRGPGLVAWNDSRPDYCEQMKIWEAAYTAKLTGCPLYIVHTTVGTVKETVHWARANGVELYVETCHPYLTFTMRDRKIDYIGKVAPPIRTKGHLELLWQGIRDGWVVCVGSDHCPVNKERKVVEGDIWATRLGYATAECLLPVMISEGHNKRGVPLETIVAVTATNTARIHNITGKGAIRPGYDADLVIVDLKKKVKGNGELFRYSEIRDFNLYEDWAFNGYPITTIVRGQVVSDGLELQGKPGYGKVIKRSPRNGPKKPTLKYLIE